MPIEQENERRNQIRWLEKGFTDLKEMYKLPLTEDTMLGFKIASHACLIRLAIIRDELTRIEIKDYMIRLNQICNDYEHRINVETN